MKKTFKSFLYLAIAASTVLTSCGEDTPVTPPVENEEGTVVLTENITANETWTKDKVYELAGRIAVTDGVTLTIEPGTVIKGRTGTGANATALIIARGAKLMAEGTADEPIIFTAKADEIVSGQVVSPNLDPSYRGLWGGVLILGKAPASLGGDVTETAIEGIPGTDPNGRYGGNVANDNSGVIKYISIRHGGTDIGDGNEINGLTLGGVGNGTVIENVEVVSNVDDGIEFFGGTVNVTNAVVWGVGDDAIDTDQAWSGTLDNFIVVCGDQTDHALEIDGPEGSMNAGHTVKNGTIKGDANSELADFRSNPQGTFENLYFYNFPDPAATDGRGDFGFNKGDNGDDLRGEKNFADGVLIFMNNLESTLPAGVALESVFKQGTAAKATAVSTATVGANKGVFGWSWTVTAGNF